MLVPAINAIKKYYANTRHFNAESCRGYNITCYKKILGRLSDYKTVNIYVINIYVASEEPIKFVP
jgi:hypothetical protein